MPDAESKPVDDMLKTLNETIIHIESKRELPVELVSIIFSHISGHLERIIKLKDMLGGLSAARAIFARSWLRLPYNLNETNHGQYKYQDEEMHDHEFLIHVGSFVAFKELFEHDGLKKAVQFIQEQDGLNIPMSIQLCEQIKGYIVKIKDQLTNLRICDDGDEYPEGFPVFKHVTHVEIRGILLTAVPLKFNVKFPAATTVKNSAQMTSINNNGLVNCTKLRVFEAIAGHFHYPE